jgi:hypothetical protein
VEICLGINENDRRYLNDRWCRCLLAITICRVEEGNANIKKISRILLSPDNGPFGFLFERQLS